MQKGNYCKNVFVLLVIASIMSATPVPAVSESTAKNECVVLIHGMGRSNISMRKMEKYLYKKGYTTINVDYPSTTLTVAEISRNHVEPAVQKCQTAKAQKIHFATHSLGGIVVRQYLQNHVLPMGSRVVMLAPPNNGSEVTDKLRKKWWYEWMMGPAGQCLGTEPGSLPKTLPDVPGEIGIIAGKRSSNPLFSMWLEGDDDGKVSVASTKLNGMTDFLIVSATHTFIMRDKTVLAEVDHFLRSGKFSGNNGHAAGKEG